MSLANGDRLGPYEILDPIGAGGMGEVYRARDSRLDRIVAIKVLPEHLAQDSSRRQRFEREARAVSSLNHPHICSLYDVGSQDGVDFLVMEHIEGETLADRLESGPLPVGETLRYATQIADALDKAHRQGVLHRDLKPGNIMLTRTGAKLLDFGLAKSTSEMAPAVSGLTAMPTSASPLTAEGTIVGTFQYIAPELLEAKEADVRSDIFSFGAVVYEMATGRSAFTGKTQASLIASVLKEEPRPLADLAPMTPPGLERLIRACMAKDPDERRQTMHDVLLDLRWIQDAGSQAGVPAPVVSRRKTRERIAWLSTASALVAAVVFMGLWLGRGGEPPRTVRSTILPPEGTQIVDDAGIALSPDGSRIALVASGKGQSASLWVRHLDNLEAQRLAGTEGASLPFWSPDSRSLGFFAQGKLKRIDAAGGPTQTLADAPTPRGGAWSRIDQIVFNGVFREGLTRIPASGGSVESLTTIDIERGETSHRWPVFLPDGRHVVFLSQTSEGGAANDESQVEVLDLVSGDRRPLFGANSSIQLAPSGHLFFWREGTVYAQPFEPAEARLVPGDVLPVAEKVGYSGLELAAFTVSEQEGTLAYMTGTGLGGVSQMFWYDRSGKQLEPLGDLALFDSPVLSHDGRRLAFELAGDIWIRDLARGTSTRLTFDGADEWNPVWSADDRWVFYSSGKSREITIFRKQASGLGEQEVIYSSDGFPEVTDSSPSGRTLLLMGFDPETGWDIWIYSLEEQEAKPLIRTPFADTRASFSPDENWLVYASDETERSEIYVYRLADPGGRWQISTNGGAHPRWGAGGNEILYFEDDKLMAVDVDTGETLEAGIPRILFEAPRRRSNVIPYDISSDGQRFVINLANVAETVYPVTLVQNWLEGR